MLAKNDKNQFRWYVDNFDEKYISVTQAMDHIVPRHLQNWMKKNSLAKIEKIKEHSSAFGTDIHKELEEFYEECKPAKSPCAKKATELLRDEGYTVVSCEEEVFSQEYGYAGRLDLIVFKDGQFGVADLKTGNSFSVKTGWQLSAYLKAYNEANKTNQLSFMLGVFVPRDNPEKGKLFRYTRHESCFISFLACLQTFKALYYKELKSVGWKWLDKEIFLNAD